VALNFPLVTNCIDGWKVMLTQEAMGSALEIQQRIAHHRTMAL